jgi:hypothetical protein
MGIAAVNVGIGFIIQLFIHFWDIQTDHPGGREIIVISVCNLIHGLTH